jgi:hypothetical protein
MDPRAGKEALPDLASEWIEKYKREFLAQEQKTGEKSPASRGDKLLDHIIDQMKDAPPAEKNSGWISLMQDNALRNAVTERIIELSRTGKFDLNRYLATPNMLTQWLKTSPGPGIKTAMFGRVSDGKTEAYQKLEQAAAEQSSQRAMPKTGQR